MSDIVDVRQGSWCEPCSNLLGSVSGLVSNPPYIPAEDMPNLQFEVQWCVPPDAHSIGVSGAISMLLGSCTHSAQRPQSKDQTHQLILVPGIYCLRSGRLTSLCQVNGGHEATPVTPALHTPASACLCFGVGRWAVCRHEPHEALSDGGTDGMASLSRVLECATLLLRPGGFFAFEVRLLSCLHW